MSLILQRLNVLALILIIALIPVQLSVAAEPVKVTLSQPGTDPVTAGEAIPFSIEIRVQGQFSGATLFDLPEISGAILLQVSQRPVLSSGEEEGAAYVAALHDFVVYTQVDGKLTVPPIGIRFGTKEGYDQPVVDQQVQTEPFTIDVKPLAGMIPGEVIVTTSAMDASESWSPQPVSAKVGDAFVRTITMRADGVPAMLLPAPHIEELDGLSIYPQAPQLKDETARGDLVGERIDAFTYVAERAGSFEIPELELRWWDPDDKQWHSKRFPAVTLTVEGGSAPLSAVKIELLSWPALAIAVTVVAVVLLLIRLKPVVIAWQERRAASEPVAWKRLQSACDQADATTAYRLLAHWLDFFELSPIDLSRDIPGHQSTDLAKSYADLQRALAGIDAHWDAGLFKNELTSLRQSLHSPALRLEDSPLPPLNPGSFNSSV